MLQRLFRRRITRSLAVPVMLLLTVTPVFAAAKKVVPAASSGASPGWQATIVGSDASPSNLIAVDKTQQTLFLFERHSPLRLVGKYACTTGQNDGDKFEEGDLKTPEGVYFVIKRIGAGLNFEKYGYEAYTLNYPNPVDKLRKKTGYGIWIHGRGSPITPNLTEGCVSLNNPDIAVLGKNLMPGTPVALAAKVDFLPAPTTDDTAVISQLYTRTQEWVKAWSGRSKKFFDYYDADAYAIAQGESFKAFREQKEQVFKAVSFIDTKVQNMQALQGPGYWVTWFQQDYRASNLSTNGVRRLYWQKDKKGELRIVGMEWEPHLSGTLTAGLNGAPIAGEVPVAQAAPVTQAAPVVQAAPVAQTVSVETPGTRAVPVEKPAPVAQAAPVELTEEPVILAMAAPAAKPESVAGGSKKDKTIQFASAGDVSVFIEAWRAAWENGDIARYADCYDKNALQGSRLGAAAIRSHKAGLWKKSRPRHVVLTNVRITTKQDMIVADMHQAYTDSNSFADMGIKTLYMQVKNNTWRIVREDWSPMQQ